MIHTLSKMVQNCPKWSNLHKSRESVSPVCRLFVCVFQFDLSRCGIKVILFHKKTSSEYWFTGDLIANHTVFLSAQYLGDSWRQTCVILGAWYLIPLIINYNIAPWADWLIGSKLHQIKPLTNVDQVSKHLKACLMSSMRFSSHCAIWRRVFFTRIKF